LSAVTLVLTLSAVSKAQDAPPIVTDRPDVTESAIVVPPWSLQVENGVTWTLQSGQRTVSGTESLLRLGVAPGMELRFGLPDYVLNLSTGRLPDGFNDLSVGFKQQVGPLPGGIALSIIVAATLPTGTRGITTGGIDPFLKLPWSKELSRGWSIGGMQSLFWTSRNGYRNPTWEPTLTLTLVSIFRPLVLDISWQSAIHSDSICASESNQTHNASYSQTRIAIRRQRSR
jgi:hypothetical protein